jgi:hypothetical protein
MDYTFKDEEKTAMRAYLQRAEVRLSTMHRIASAFLSGAGLLLLFPILFKDAFVIIFTQVLSLFSNIQDYQQLLKLSCFFVPLFITLYIPIRSLLFLLKDITLFYYKPHRLYFSESGEHRDTLFHPRFAITGLAFPRDESDNARNAINDLQMNSNLKNFVIPYKDKEKQHLIEMVQRDIDFDLIPPSRRTQINDHSDNDWKCFLGSLGLAGAYDLSLVEEVAKMEASLVRHNIRLRRLVLRYMKSLLILVFTTLSSLVIASVVDSDASTGLKWQNIALTMAIYIAWSILTPAIVKLPIGWIKSISDMNKESDKFHSDKELIAFEEEVVKWCKFSLVFAIAGLVGAICASLLAMK